MSLLHFPSGYIVHALAPDFLLLDDEHMAANVDYCCLLCSKLAFPLSRHCIVLQTFSRAFASAKEQITRSLLK